MTLPRLYTPQSAAAAMGIDAGAIEAAIDAGALGHLMLGGRPHLTAEQLHVWLARSTVPPSGESPCPAAPPQDQTEQGAAVPAPDRGSSGSQGAPAGTSAGPGTDEQRSAARVVAMAQALIAPSGASTRKRAPSRRKRPVPDPRQLVLLPNPNS